MARITDKENRELAEMMLSEDWTARREREEAHRTLPDDEQPWMVVFFGMLDYRVLWIAPKGGKAHAEREMEWWQEKARRGRLAIPGFTRNASEHDFQIRQQWDLDALTKAILSSYP